ncbi:hypothetical protein H5410_059651 [Solanum commersonii]|uniref:Vesicle transport protein n=1 Tax=Solanum commersonii TaxID=4109 RepID=A0A9J5W306_SOLCO|nr:hypothetical protein H5410_059651 [Solanum commersonii]
MHKTAQSWFTGGPSNDLEKTPSSLLADWNAYAATQDEGSSSDLGFDLEAAVRTANDKVSGTFNVSKRFTRKLPICNQQCSFWEVLMYFGLFLAAGVFFIFIAFTMFLPVMVLMPQKFAICFTIGCAFIIGSFFALKGPKNQLTHMTSKEIKAPFPSIVLAQFSAISLFFFRVQRLPFTALFISSMVGTIYVSMVLHSYILSVLFSVIQVLALSYYVISYFPGGSAGMRFLSSTLTSSIFRCFGR